jgi:predicted porin
MNKKFVALAVSSLIAGIASAQTANVVLYGRVDVVIENVRTSFANGTSTSVNRVTDGATGGLSGSRWGLRGSESLGGGLNAVFQLEGGTNADVGTLGQGGLLFGRQAYVGLNGGFGSVTLGRQYAPIFYVADSLDSPAHDLSAQSVVGTFLRYSRVNNSVVYSTPNMGGVSASLMYGFGETQFGNSAGRHVGANLQYANGPLYAGLGYHQDNLAANAVVTAPPAAPIVVAKAGDRNGRSINLGLGYDFGVVRPSLMYQEHVDLFGTKRQAYVLTADIKAGGVTIEPQYGEEKNKRFGGKQKRLNLTASYDLSKRTTTYASLYNQRHSGAYVAETGVTKLNVFLVGFRNKF